MLWRIKRCRMNREEKIYLYRIYLKSIHYENGTSYSCAKYMHKSNFAFVVFIFFCKSSSGAGEKIILGGIWGSFKIKCHVSLYLSATTCAILQFRVTRGPQPDSSARTEVKVITRQITRLAYGVSKQQLCLVLARLVLDRLPETEAAPATQDQLDQKEKPSRRIAWPTQPMESAQASPLRDMAAVRDLSALRGNHGPLKVIHTRLNPLQKSRCTKVLLILP